MSAKGNSYLIPEEDLDGLRRLIDENDLGNYEELQAVFICIFQILSDLKKDAHP